jgi:hypothetical protein
MARFAARAVTVVLLLVGAAEAWMVTEAIRGGVTTAIGIDVNQYLAHTHRWLDGGGWYLPEQLAGPYIVEDVTGNVYPPTLLYLTVPFVLGLPMVLWYAIPVALIAFTYWRRPPAWWAWPLVAGVLAYPRTWTMLVLGNPALWAIAFAVAGVTWGWMAWGATVKVTFAPLVLVGIRRRSWWYAIPVVVLLALPFGSLWLDFVTVLRNTHSSRGLEYVLGEWPIAIALVVAAWSADSPRGAVHGSLRHAPT